MATLKLTLVDVYGQRINERVDIILRHQDRSSVFALRGFDARKAVVFRNLPPGVYRLLVDPPSYHPAAMFLPVDGEREKTLVFAVDPEKVISLECPAFSAVEGALPLLDASRQVLGFDGKAGEALYNALDDIRRAGLLNILAKCRRTRTARGAAVIESLREVRELRGDRFFAVVPHELREDVKNSLAAGLFFEVNGSLHRPPDGYSLAGSYKTPDSYGNLQLTFFSSGDNWMADIDIDDAGGLEHFFQVLRNSVTGRPTHPYDIHQILIARQELDPGYRLITGTEPARRAASQKG